LVFFGFIHTFAGFLGLSELRHRLILTMFCM